MIIKEVYCQGRAEYLSECEGYRLTERLCCSRKRVG